MTSEDHRHDLTLARIASQGNEEAWRRIYDDTCQGLFNLLCYQVGNRETAKDLLQETYLAAARNLSGYEGRGSLYSWLRGIALKRALDWKRSLWRRLRKLNALAQETPRSHSVPSDAGLELRCVAIREALEGLSSQQRAALLLRELEDLDFAEIARTIGCSEGTARVHYHRALKKIKNQLAEGKVPVAVDGIGGQQA